MGRRLAQPEQSGKTPGIIYDEPAVRSASQGAQGDLPPTYGDVVDGPPRAYPDEKQSRHTGAGAELPSDEDSGSELGSTYTGEFENDEDDWALDEAAQQADQAGLPSYEESEIMQANETTEDLIHDVMTSVPSSSKTFSDKKSTAIKPLRCPVIIPQRRPKNGAHGFVRAYAPILGECGIDEDTFIRFLKNFHKTVQVSPVFPAVRIATSVAGMDPATVAMAVTIAASAAAGMGPEAAAGYQVNDYLDRMNETLFQPVGLYAMITKYASDADMQQLGTQNSGSLTGLIRADHVNFSTSDESMPRYNRPEDAKGGHDMEGRMSSMKLTDHTGRGPVQHPQTAPLVFPAVDRMLSSGVPGIVGNSLLGVSAVVSDYVERRSQMNIPSRQLGYAHKDPSHPLHAQVPSLISWATGGAYNPRQNIRDRRVERHIRRDVRRLESGRALRHGRKRERQYGDAYFDEVERRTEERRYSGASVPRSANNLPGQQADGSDRRAAGRGFLAGGLVAGLLGVAANTVAEATGNASYGRDNHAGPSSHQVSSSAARSWDGQAPYEADYHADSKDASELAQGEEITTVKRVMKDNVLYLAIVNMPSEVEMSEAWEELEANGAM